MDVLRSLKENYATVLLVGVILLTLACVFAFVEFTKVKSQDYTWRALSVTCFIAGIITLLGIMLFAGYSRYCNNASLLGNRTIVEGGGGGAGFGNTSELELNPQ
uniref:IMV membrane protein n=1 Tax=Rousettus bat poxvirus TaxID=3141933 RepID=A0AAU7E0Z6_9POXV